MTSWLPRGFTPTARFVGDGALVVVGVDHVGDDGSTTEHGIVVRLDHTEVTRAWFRICTAIACVAGADAARAAEERVSAPRGTP
jgi:hypothetical protein